MAVPAPYNNNTIQNQQVLPHSHAGSYSRHHELFKLLHTTALYKVTHTVLWLNVRYKKSFLTSTSIKTFLTAKHIEMRVSSFHNATHCWQTFLPFFRVNQCIIQTSTHPHAGLQADLWHDWEEGDASLHSSTLGTDNLVWVRRLWEVCGAALVRCKGYWCYVRTLRERWDRWVRGAALMDWKLMAHAIILSNVHHQTLGHVITCCYKCGK